MKMKTKTKNATLMLLSVIILSSVTACHKEGIGGKSSITGKVVHHDHVIPHAVVYIKYGATEFPGVDVTLYDAHSSSDANAHYEFHNLRKGVYYLYGVGFDNTISSPVNGGGSVKLKYNKSVESDVAVTE